MKFPTSTPEQMFFILCHSVIFVFFVAAIVLAWKRILKRRNTSANALLVPFAYFSLIAWMVWGLQYVILITRPFSLVQGDISLTTGLLLGVMQNVSWIIAISSLHSKQFSKVSRALPLLGMISIVIALVAFQTRILILKEFAQIDAVSAATIFTVLAVSVVKSRVSKLIAGVFFLHGYIQWVWRDVWLDESSFRSSAFALWHLILLGAWFILISEMLVTSRVMISSTIKDLAPEREAAERAVLTLNLEGFRSETIGSRPYTPKALCALWAEQCNIFILIIGERYGYRIKSRRKSVVEFEYETARKQDPGKILVYVKDGVTREPELDAFLSRVEDFERGRFRSSFTTPDDLYVKIQRDVADWLTSRGAE